MANGVQGKTILVTGATDGLGKALALRLAAEGATLLLHGRNVDKLADIASAAQAAGAASVATFLADLAELAQVARLASEVQASAGRLDVLVNNAGVGFGEPDPGTRYTTPDGNETRFAINHLAVLLLSLDLLPLLRASAPSRIVNIASVGQEAVDFDDLQLENAYDGFTAYRRSKLAQIIGTIELASRVPAAEVTVNTVHPATFMPTQMVATVGIEPKDSVEQGVASVHRLIVDPELASVTGAYFDQLERAEPEAQAADADARARLWQRSLELIGR